MATGFRIAGAILVVVGELALVSGLLRLVPPGTTALYSRRSGMDQLDVASRGLRQPFKILTVDRHDLVPVHCEQHDTGVDDVCKPRGPEELPRRPTKRLIEGADLDSAERL